jgi:hypothetical protein
MKDIGYYAGWLNEETQADIENSDSEDLLEMIADIAMDIRGDILGDPLTECTKFMTGNLSQTNFL